MVGGDAISIQEARRKTHRGRKEEGEAVKPGGVGGGGGDPQRCCGADFHLFFPTSHVAGSEFPAQTALPNRMKEQVRQPLELLLSLLPRQA
jgi:hypothetical protein